MKIALGPRRASGLTAAGRASYGLKIYPTRKRSAFMEHALNLRYTEECRVEERLAGSVLQDFSEPLLC